MPPTKANESSQDDGLILVELTPDELLWINQQRAIYGEIKKGISWSGKPAYLDTTIETPDKIIEIKYHPLTTEWNERKKTRNPNKVSFGVILWGKSRFEAYSYKPLRLNDVALSLNGKTIWINKFRARILMSISMKIALHFGIIGRKRRK
jgi:hypothetical protein